MNRLSKKIFSLVEFLIVLAIVVALASLTVPSLNKLNSASNNITCSKNLSSINLMHGLYHENWAGAIHWVIEPIQFTNTPFRVTESKTFFNYFEINYSHPYDQIFNCPSAESPYVSNAMPGYINRNSYGFNTLIGNVYNWSYYMSRFRYKEAMLQRRYLIQISNPSKQIVYGDMNGSEKDPEVSYWRHYILGPRHSNEDIRPVARHLNHSFNIGFLDGHVENMFPEEILEGAKTYEEISKEYWNLLEL